MNIKKQILAALLIFTSVATFSQVNLKEIDKSIVEIEKILYASKYEVSNELYSTFLKSLIKSGDVKNISITKIDTSKWRESTSNSEPFVDLYHSHPAYKKYPVVNISHEAAMMFCKWLTNEYNSNPKRKFKKVIFRLPSEKEWIMAAQAGNSSAIYPWKGDRLQNKKGEFVCNFKHENKDTVRLDGKPNKNVNITARVDSYRPNKFGIYNMSGNVSEMINKNGIAKGGSWYESLEFLTIASKSVYDGSAKSFVGFRYFVDIIKK
ncbi:MAG: SUMF1/EgtB/PvdO family nonheme iron enzyme [Bacteroidetes bacterium]|nr:SUMF1/EgtB/PvdO family nonheme iron enzyme [Bacteroidota bacterium]